MYKFEKLNVWQEALKFAEICYQVASTLPNIERNGLSNQLRRASTSILLNIAEGSGSETDKEFIRYLHLSRKSFFETIAILKFIEKIYRKENIELVFSQGDLVGKLINGLIRKIKSDS